MRDRVMEELKAELARRDTYENKCPICEMCGQRIMDEYFYDVDGTYICDSYECVTDFMRGFRKSLESYIEGI